MTIDRIAARRALVGEIPPDATVIVTAISGIARSLTHKWVQQTPSGWWPRWRHGNAHVVVIPQGGAVADLGLCARDLRAVLLLGYAGSLSPRYGIGDIVAPGSVRLLGGVERTLSGGAGDPPPRALTTSSLLESYRTAVEGLTEGADIADMECGHLAGALGPEGPPLSAMFLVTDRWPDLPFYHDSTRAMSLRQGHNALAAKVLYRLESTGVL